MGDNMLMADIGLVASAMTALNVDPDIVDEVTQMLLDNSDGLKGQVVTDVAESWFGGSGNAHRIGVNTKMAHQEVVDEFQKLADSLRDYSDAILKWASDVRDIDGDTNAEMMMRSAALQEVNTIIDDARNEATSDTMGDGSYTDPTGSGA